MRYRRTPTMPRGIQAQHSCGHVRTYTVRTLHEQREIESTCAGTPCPVCATQPEHALELSVLNEIGLAPATQGEACELCPALCGPAHVQVSRRATGMVICPACYRKERRKVQPVWERGQVAA